MYDTQEIADRIKLEARKKKIAVKDLTEKCGLGVNAISKFSNGKELSCISLARIADILSVSTDYLLGRAAK